MYPAKNTNKSNRKLYVVRKILNILDESTVMQSDIDKAFNIIENHITEDLLSPAQIKEKYGLSIISNFTTFIKYHTNIKILSCKENGERQRKFHREKTNVPTRKIYAQDCQFSVDPYSATNIPGYEELLLYGMYHPTRNPGGMTRDHMISIEYGFRNNIDPKIISHPANCQFISNIQNLSKGSSSCLTINELLLRIENGNYHSLNLTSIKLKKLPKTKEHKNKISETLVNKCWINNGKINKHVYKFGPLECGWYFGKIPKIKK